MRLYPQWVAAATASLGLAASGSVYRVPSDYGTIQAALDALSEGDSVLIALGTYNEALLAPPIRFFMLGDVPEDTSDFVRPIVDSGPVSGSDSLACLILPAGCEPVIMRLKFRTGSGGYPRGEEQGISGIRILGNGPTTFRFCVFDSLFGAICPGSPEQQISVTLEWCRFENGTWIQLNALRGSLQVSDCEFHGDNAQLRSEALVACNDNNLFERCLFTCRNCQEVLGCGRSGNRIRNCVFGPCSRTGWSVLSLSNRGDNFVEHNLFVGCDVLMQVVNYSHIEGDPLVFARNEFLIRVSGPSCTGGAITVQRGDTSAPLDMVIEENDFVCAEFFPCSIGVTSKGLLLQAPAVVQRNRFVNLRPENHWTIISTDSFGGGTIVRENLFIGNELGLEARAFEVDARFNYWGDSSGPYHETLNPEGMGDEVRGNVLFEPWYPDSSFLEAPPRTEPSVASYALRAFPNPFNASVTLKFEIPEPGIFRIELFDLLGRRVKELFVGPVAYEKIVRVDGSDHASGIYYARAWQTTHNRPVATAKLVLLK